MEEDEEVAPDQATVQWRLAEGERSSRVRSGGRGAGRRVDSRIWIRLKGRETKQFSIPPTCSTWNSIFRYLKEEWRKRELWNGVLFQVN